MVRFDSVCEGGWYSWPIVYFVSSCKQSVYLGCVAAQGDCMMASQSGIRGSFPSRPAVDVNSHVRTLRVVIERGRGTVIGIHGLSVTPQP